MDYDAEFFVLLGFLVFVGVLIYFGVPSDGAQGA